MSNEFRQHIWQVQKRESLFMRADYEADGMGHLFDGEWRNVLKKAYPWKTASKHYRLIRDEGSKATDVRFVKVDRDTGEVVREVAITKTDALGFRNAQ